jgi:hypothetical protein
LVIEKITLKLKTITIILTASIQCWKANFCALASKDNPLPTCHKKIVDFRIQPKNINIFIHTQKYIFSYASTRDLIKWLRTQTSITCITPYNLIIIKIMQTNCSKEPKFDFWWKQFFVRLYLRRTSVLPLKRR